MIAKKLVLVRNGSIIHQENQLSRVIPDLQTLKYIIYKKTKNGGYVMTVAVLRFYVNSNNLLKNLYEKTKTKIENLKRNDKIENKEASKFLKMISDYKYKIRNIKRQIEEENEFKN